MDENDRLIERLRSLSRAKIDPDVAGRHLGTMAGVRAGAPRFVKLKVGSALAVGLVFGGTGLASAGVLPASVQQVAHGALSQVGVSVPSGHPGHGPVRYNGPECTGGPYANHGQYVRAHRSDPNAGSSRCGKPVQAGNDGTTSGTEAPEAPETDQGGQPATAHSGHGHKGKPDTTPSPSVTVPAPAVPTTTNLPGNRAESNPTSTSTSSSTSTTTVAPTTTVPSSTTSSSSSTTAASG